MIDFHLQIAATKKFRLTTIFSFIDELMELGSVIVSWKDTVLEFKDLDDTEKQQLYQYVRDEFDIPNDQVEAWVEDVFQWLLSSISLIERIKILKKK